ncbi:hypothetical protein N0V85_001816 [Neurospora sp. IMI 360204]|nr:hypothetical protein N0V85_001816 [Neurospora sp. IMI 360204]
MASKSKENSNDGSGHLHAKLVDDAESVMRQFSLPVCSTTLLDEILSKRLSAISGPAQWRVYHQLVNVQRLQLESLFNCILGFNEAACTGMKGAGTGYIKLDSEKLVNKEGLASLKADYELILKLITKLTAQPGQKTPAPQSELYL